MERGIVQEHYKILTHFYPHTGVRTALPHHRPGHGGTEELGRQLMGDGKATPAHVDGLWTLHCV